jgi:hypothetical protein
MKFLLHFLFCTTGALTANPVSRLAAEWLVPVDQNEQLVVLVDAATGTVRTGQVSSDGSVGWRNPVPTGITNVSDAASLTDQVLAITSPISNRVSIIDLGLIPPSAFTLPGGLRGIGPTALSELRTAGNSHLLVNSILNSGAVFGKAEVSNKVKVSGDLLSESNYVLDFRRAQPLADPLSPENRVAFYTATSGGNTLTGLLSQNGSVLSRTEKSTYAGVLEFIPGILDVNGNSSRPLILGYEAGQKSARIVRVITPITTAAFTDVAADLPFAVSGIVPVPGNGASPISDGFFAISADGSGARWLRINASSTAFIEGSETFSAPPGSFLTGIVPIPGVGLIRLEGPSATGPAKSFTTLTHNGSSWEVAASGDLPSIPAADATAANLLFYTGDPAENESARLLSIENVPDWTSRIKGTPPVPEFVLRENFVSSPQGLVGGGDYFTTPPEGTGYVLTNQVQSAVSITALGSAATIFTPDLRIDPPSGTYDQSFQVAALFDEERQELLWRDGSRGTWTTWSGALPVVYSRDFQFTLRAKSGGSLGPIISRSYTLSASVLASQDSDNDGVPDYVELALGLDPFGGPDHDEDGWSDLDEILNKNDPNNSSDFPKDSKGISTTGGFRFIATARNHANSEMGEDQEILLHNLPGALLDRQKVALLSPTLPDGSKRGATLASDTPVPSDEILTLATPVYFNITTGTRSGRQTIGFIPVPAPTTFSPAFIPTGTNLVGDANGWVNAARSAADTLPPISTRTIIAPADTAVAILVEHLTYTALAANGAAPALPSFSIFPFLDSDRSLENLDAAHILTLKSAGFSFNKALSLANTVRGALDKLAVDFYTAHNSLVATTPGMPMPLDALRIVLRGGTAPTGYATASSGATINTARTAYNQILARVSEAFRPIETYTLEIPPTSRGQATYLRKPDNSEIILVRANGERFPLEQGLGLRPGTRFSVQGFTDSPLVGGKTSFEVFSVSLTFLPVSSDTDSDANLLDDDWERFFFGAIGQDPSGKPNGGTHSLLQYFLDGIDPRGTDTPTGPAVVLTPHTINFARATAGAYTLDFDFPSEYLGRFDIVLERSSTLLPNSFSPITTAVFGPATGNRTRVSIPSAAAQDSKAFYRVRIGLR